MEWPGNEGAPFYDENNDGKFTSGIDKPLFIGDEVLWCVMNDMDSSRTLYTFGTMPIGLEIQLTVYGYTHSSLENVLIKNYTVINKSVNTIDSMFFSYWADTDIGNTHDDYVGCDSLINLGYCYNADPDDNNYYGYLPPAVGYLLLEGAKIKGTYYDSAKYNYNWVQGLKDLKMTSFSFSHSSYPVCSSLPLNVVQYNRLNGLICHGVSYINPIDGNATKFPFYGNPVDSTGWYMGYQNSLPPDDVTLLINSGPVTMAPGDTQEVAIAIIAALGSDHLKSITKLKETAQTVQYFYDNFSLEFANTSYRKPLPEYYYLSQNYPNPFNPGTRVDYDLPISGYTTLIVYDILGNKISTLVNEEKNAGSYSVYFDGSKLSSGVYIYSIQVRDFVKSRKMILLR